jgi:glucose-1-phosphatase
LASFLACFDSAFSSHLLGEIKPDRAVFETVLCALRVDASAVRFFDDSRANVDAARTFGIAACLVEDYAHLRELLGCEGKLEHA